MENLDREPPSLRVMYLLIQPVDSVLSKGAFRLVTQTARAIDKRSICRLGRLSRLPRRGFPQIDTTIRVVLLSRSISTSALGMTRS